MRDLILGVASGAILLLIGGGVAMNADVRALQTTDDHQKEQAKDLRKDVRKNKKKLNTIDKRQIRQDMILDGIADKLDVHTPPQIPEDRDDE